MSTTATPDRFTTLPDEHALPTQVQQMKAIGGQPDYALGSVQAVTRDGTLIRQQVGY